MTEVVVEDVVAEAEAVVESVEDAEVLNKEVLMTEEIMIITEVDEGVEADTEMMTGAVPHVEAVDMTAVTEEAMIVAVTEAVMTGIISMAVTEAVAAGMAEKGGIERIQTEAVSPAEMNPLQTIHHNGVQD